MAANPYVEAARGLAQLIAEHRETFDVDRRLAPPVVAAMRAADLFNLWLPRALGGPELSLADSLAVIETLSYLDGAVGWCSGIAASISRLGAFLPETSARHIFVDHHSVIAGAFMPTGVATVVPGGYRVAGRWAYGSGIDHSQYVIAGCAVETDGIPRLLSDGTPEIRMVFVPRNAVEIIDTWHVGGLRGTGSHDYRITDCFVPDTYTVIGQGESSTCPSPLYRIPPYTVFPMIFGAVVFGIARAALDRVTALATSKTPRALTSVLRDDPVAQTTLGRAEARLRAARAFLREAVETVWQAAEAGEAIKMEHRLSARLACAEAIEAAKFAVDSAYDLGGGSSVYEKTGIERCFRDLHTAAQHLQAQPAYFRFCGQVLLGLEPGISRF